MQRALWFTLGCLFVALGVIGAFLPVMPTTVFLILAAWAFARSSPRLEAWILHHPRFGPSVRAWRENGAIPPRAKGFATAGIVGGFIIFHLSARPSPPVALPVALCLAATLGWILSRPD